MPKLTSIPGEKVDKPPTSRPSRVRGARATTIVVDEAPAHADREVVTDATPDLLSALADSLEKAGQARKAREADENPTEDVPEPETGEQPTEEPEAKGDGKEGEGDKPKRPKRRPPTVTVRPAAKQFTPDLSKLVPLNDKTDYLRVILYGDAGVGKSTSLASLAHRGRVAIVDPENSIRPRALRRVGIPTDNLLLWTDWSHEGMEQFFITIKAELEREPGSIFAVGIDTGTALVQFLLEEAVGMSLAQPDMQKKHPNRTSLDVFRDDYGTMSEMINSTVTRKLYELPCHVAATAHTRRGESESGAVRVGPDFPPAVQQALMTYSDWVLHMTREEDKAGNSRRFVRSAPKGQIEAKDRFNVLQPVEEDQSLLDLLQIWEADEDEDTNNGGK